MKDRELLELAAKAAGIEGEWRELRSGSRDHFNQIRYKRRNAFVAKGIVFDPLADDGDALRLAVHLGMVVEITKTDIFAACFGSCSEPAGCNPLQATRRAIVRAAAEVGKAMS